MRRLRLRNAHTDELLGKYYAKPHSHFGNADHRLRVAISINLARALGQFNSVADLACGDAAISAAMNARTRYLGDLAAGYAIQGPIEETIHQIPHVDLFVCTETIEHLDDPDTVVRAIRGKADALLLSTPVGCFHDQNPEHYWAWDREAVEAMADEAGFKTSVYAELDLTAAGPEHYVFGIWGMR
jgi:hypothetical protein